MRLHRRHGAVWRFLPFHALLRFRPGLRLWLRWRNGLMSDRVVIAASLNVRLFRVHLNLLRRHWQGCWLPNIHPVLRPLLRRHRLERPRRIYRHSALLEVLRRLRLRMEFRRAAVGARLRRRWTHW